MNDQIIQLLDELASFNKLDIQTVNIISSVFNVDAKQLCKENGITYFTE